MRREIYFDNSATTKPFENIISELNKVGEAYGNPSSLHEKGLETEKIIKNAREKVADSLGVSSGEIFFTPSGTISNNIAIQGFAKALGKRTGALVTTQIEHPSVKEVFRYLESSNINTAIIPVDEKGIIKIEELEHVLKSQNVSMLSIMHVNNEIGSVQPLNEIVRLKNKYNFALHLDAVQSFLKIKIPSKEIDLLSFSGHKIHALKGVGGLYIKKGTKLEPIFFGGGQENKTSPGTENVLGIWSVGKAIENYNSQSIEKYKKVREIKLYFIQRVLSSVKNTGLNGSVEDEISAPHIANIWFEGIPAEVILHALESKMIYVSTGSACSSKKKDISYVLKAISLDDDKAKSSVRFSLSIFNTIEEVEFVVAELIDIVKKHRR